MIDMYIYITYACIVYTHAFPYKMAGEISRCFNMISLEAWNWWRRRASPASPRPSSRALRSCEVCGAWADDDMVMGVSTGVGIDVPIVGDFGHHQTSHICWNLYPQVSRVMWNITEHIYQPLFQINGDMVYPGLSPHINPLLLPVFHKVT